MTIDLRLGDCLAVLQSIPDCSVQCCVTSPPYFGLRDYGTAKWEGGDPECDHKQTVARHDGGRVNTNGFHGSAAANSDKGGMNYRDVCGKCGAVRIDGQIGLEPSPEEYIARLVAVFAEVRRVLKDDGTLWLNLGDSYASQGGGQVVNTINSKREGGSNTQNKGETRKSPDGYKPKDLLMIPARVALALQADGWYLRSEIIWHKPNPMPESVRDRPTKAHEMIYLLAKSQRYYYDAEAVREPNSENSHSSAGIPNPGRKALAINKNLSKTTLGSWTPETANGRNRRDVWTVTTKPYKEAHFATFPPDLIEPCILAGTSERGECPKCGKAWVRVVEKTGEFQRRWSQNNADGSPYKKQSSMQNVYKETGWRPSCTCIDESDHNGPFEPIPQTVIDPFNGSGTTGAVSVMHGRQYIGIELNPAYIELSQKRISKQQLVMTE
jgi:DNA modification methylase